MNGLKQKSTAWPRSAAKLIKLLSHFWWRFEWIFVVNQNLKLLLKEHPPTHFLKAAKGHFPGTKNWNDARALMKNIRLKLKGCSQCFDLLVHVLEVMTKGVTGIVIPLADVNWYKSQYSGKCLFPKFDGRLARSVAASAAAVDYSTRNFALSICGRESLVLTTCDTMCRKPL